MLKPASWDTFRRSGLLWWVNRTLHLFGWAIVVQVDEAGKVTKAYPARSRFRGFDSESEDQGYKRLTEYLRRNVAQLKRDVEL